MLICLVLAQVDRSGRIRWGELKEISFLGRPYKTPRIIFLPPNFIKLLYTMTPSKTISFQLVNPLQNFFLFFKPTFGRLIQKHERHTTNEQDLRDTARE